MLRSTDPITLLSAALTVISKKGKVNVLSEFLRTLLGAYVLNCIQKAYKISFHASHDPSYSIHDVIRTNG